MRQPFLHAAAIGLCLTLAPCALAQAPARLAEVQKAYADVDYERTRTLASAALRSGGNDRGTTAQLYVLLATSAAALDQTDEARNAFARALAANPELKLERSLSPKIRAPYLEARGAMAGASDEPPLELTLRQRKQSLELGLRDSLHVAASVSLATRSSDHGPFRRQELEAKAEQRVPVGSATSLHYFVQVLDEHRNVLFELGSEDDPQRLRLVSTAPSSAPTPPSSPKADRSPTGYYVTAATLGALALGAGAGAAVMYLRREDAADDWNGPSCEQPGRTREQQCGTVDDRRRRAEYWSIGLAATSGALLLGSVVTLVVAPSTPARPELTVDAGANDVMLRLRARL